MTPLLILFAVAFQAYMVTRCPSGLGMESLLAAQALQHGLLPYRDFKMHVGPVATGLFGALFAIPPLAWCGIVFGLFNLATAWGIYKIAPFERKSALAAAGLFLLASPFFAGNALQVETMMVTFGVWAYVFTSDGRHWLMAIMLFLAMATKQTGLVYTLAMLPFFEREEWRATGTVFLVGGLSCLALALSVHAWQPTWQQLSGWTLNHAILDPWGMADRLWLTFRLLLPIIVIMIFVPKQFPRPYSVVVDFFTPILIAVPEGHFVLGMLPFLCLMAVAAIRSKQAWLESNLWFIGIAAACLLMPLTVKFFNQIGVTGRVYGLMDAYDSAALIRDEAPLKEPIWTNWPNLYFVLGVAVPGNDFLAQIQACGKNLDFHKEPYKSANTRIYLSHGRFDFEKPEGGTWKDYPLERGQYKTMRIWRRK